VSKIPKKVAAGVMLMVATLLATDQRETQSFLVDPGKHHVWELGCSPNSMLTVAVSKKGLPPSM
jgi:hypothetical protein